MKHFLVLPLCLLLLASCDKWQDKPATDPHLTNPYCNDPLAVNYNWGFPGKPDNTVCFYPSDIFRGTFIYQDSVYLADNTFVFATVDTLYIFALSQTKIAIVGLCPAGDSLKLTAARNFYATADTLITGGQAYCRVEDTLSGTMRRDAGDTGYLYINFTVVSDTGITQHIGLAKKQ